METSASCEARSAPLPYPTATSMWLTACPRRRNSWARRRRLLQVHRSGDSGSPRVTGSTNFSKSRSSAGSLVRAFLRPPPRLRTGPWGVPPGLASASTPANPREWHASTRRFITQNWRGKPLVSHEVIVNLIAATKTRTGLHVKSQLDTRAYPKGIKVSDAEFATIRLHPDAFHGDWNYSINPRL